MRMQALSCTSTSDFVRVINWMKFDLIEIAGTVSKDLKSVEGIPKQIPFKNPLKILKIVQMSCIEMAESGE